MVNASGAEAIRNRSRRGTAAQQRARAVALGYDVTERDFLPAKNKRFPYYSRARDRDCFARDGDPRLLEPGRPITRYHRRNDVQEAVGSSKRTLVIERPLRPEERREMRQWARRAAKGQRAGSASTSSANSSPSSTLSSKSSSASSATSERWFALTGAVALNCLIELNTVV